MKKLLVPAIFLLMNYGFSQEKIPFIDYEKLIEEASLNGREGKNEKVLEILNQVNKNDSTYCSVLITKSYYLLNLKRFEEAIEVVEEGFGRDCPDSNLSYFMNKGVALESLERLEEATELYDNAIKIYPKNAQLWNNKGIVLEKLERTKEAIEAYQRAILYQPTYRKPHLQLGNILYRQEKMAQAIMCFNTYLLLEPDADDAFNILSSLNNLVISRNTNTANPELLISPDDDSFDMVDLVLENKLALNANYEMKNKINIPIIKQNHALLDQLKDYEGAGGFWSQTYVPLYQWISETDSFDNFAYTLSFSIQNEDYKKVVEKNIDGVKSFIEAFQTKWRELLSRSTFRPEKEEQGHSYYYLNSNLEAVGKMEGEKTVGEWKFYNADGSYGGKGTFNNEGTRQGTWIWYYLNGNRKEVGNYSKGLLQGENLGYYENGKSKYIANFLNDEHDGEYRYFNEKGAMLQKKYFKEGKLGGIYQAYFAVGEDLPEFYVPYKEGKIEEKFIEYYANGDVYEESLFKNGEQNGAEKKYNFNKSLFSEINYVDGQPVGTHKTFFSNGNLKESGQYENGLFQGDFKTFYSDGSLASESNFDKGDFNGPYKFFDTDGKLHYEYDYNKGKIIAFIFYKKDGSIIDKGSKKGGEFFYKGYTPQEILNIEGLYDVKGGKTGKWNFYTSNGVLEFTGNYLEDLTVGEYREYFLNGETKAISNYENGNLSGYYVEYHPNEKMKSQGWYKDNLRVGEWRDYYIDGKLYAINNYHKGNFHGDQEFYGVSGSLTSITSYKYGEAVTDKYYNKAGEAFQVINYEVKENKYVLSTNHFNGKLQSTSSYINGVKHGPYEYYDFEGNKTIKGNYLNGSEHGEWTWFHPNGEIERISTYEEGKLNGEVKDFYDNGTLESLYFYDYGQLTGQWVSFYRNGEKETVTNYLNSENHGRKEFYSPSGKLQLVRFYDHGRLTGYSYNDKDGKELPMIELLNETGKIIAYYDNGNTSRQMEYMNGVLVNTYKAFYYDGKLENEITYENGSYNGPFTEYYANGKKKTDQEYVYDHLNGKVSLYHENGNLKEESSYINNVREGNATHYDENGKLIKKEEYLNDEVYSIEVL